MHPDETAKAVEERTILSRLSYLEKKCEEQGMRLAMVDERTHSIERSIGLNSPPKPNY